ncbi:MAG: DUF4386 family protein [Chloroflexi bacterium]|nr:DUF4386 family protein [Chloroflexota bacterium]
MKTTSFDRMGGLMAILAALAGFLYAVSFVVLKNALLYSLFLTLLGLFAFVALVAVYRRLQKVDAAYAMLALLFGLIGAAGTTIHGAYDLSNAINPPANLPAGVMDLSNQVDPRGLLTFGFTGIGLLIIAWLITRSADFPKTLGYLGYLSAILFIVIYLARLIVLNPANPILLVPVLLNGFMVSPLFYLWLGIALRHEPTAQSGKLPMAQKA